MTLLIMVAMMYVFFTYGHVCEALVDERRLCMRSLLSKGWPKSVWPKSVWPKSAMTDQSGPKEERGLAV